MPARAKLDRLDAPWSMTVRVRTRLDEAVTRVDSLGAPGSAWWSGASGASGCEWSEWRPRLGPSRGISAGLPVSAERPGAVGVHPALVVATCVQDEGEQLVELHEGAAGHRVGLAPEDRAQPRRLLRHLGVLLHDLPGHVQVAELAEQDAVLGELLGRERADGVLALAEE